MVLIVEILIVKNRRLVHSYKHSEENLLPSPSKSNDFPATSL